jgi:hypothetical protein
VASLFDKVGKLAHSPQAKKWIDRVQGAAKDPATREKVTKLKDDVTRKAKDPATREKLLKLKDDVARRARGGKAG